MPKGRAVGERIRWDGEKLAYMAEIIPGHEEREISDLFERRYGVPLTEGRINHIKTRLGIRSGTHGGRWEKGHPSHNKGRKWEEYLSEEAQARCRENTFRKGSVPPNYKPGLGHTRTGKKGEVLVKVREHREPGKPNTYEPRSRVVWEEHNGPIPPGHVVRHIDGDSANDDIANLRCVSQRANRYLNQRYARARLSAETFDSMVRVAELTFAMQDAMRKEIG